VIGKWYTDADGMLHAAWDAPVDTLCGRDLSRDYDIDHSDVCRTCIGRLSEVDPNGELFVAPDGVQW
jgi:hypothetical protein